MMSDDNPYTSPKTREDDDVVLDEAYYLQIARRSRNRTRWGLALAGFSCFSGAWAIAEFIRDQGTIPAC